MLLYFLFVILAGWLVCLTKTTTLSVTRLSRSPVKGAAINAVIVIVYFYDRSFCVVNASADDSAMCMYFVRIMFSNQMVYFRSHI